MPRAVVFVVFQQLHEEKRVLEVGLAEAEILVVSAKFLVVQVDVKQLAHLDRLRDMMDEIQPGHVLVGDFGIHAAHLGMIQRRNQRQIRSRDGEIHMPARLVRLGLERELVAELLADAVFAQEIDRLAESLDRIDRVLGRIRFDAFAAAPEDVNLRAAFRAEFHRPHRLLNRISANPRIVAGERAILEDRIGEQIRRRHRHDQAVCPSGPF